VNGLEPLITFEDFKDVITEHYSESGNVNPAGFIFPVDRRSTNQISVRIPRADSPKTGYFLSRDFFNSFHLL